MPTPPSSPRRSNAPVASVSPPGDRSALTAATLAPLSPPTQVAAAAPPSAAAVAARECALSAAVSAPPAANPLSPPSAASLRSSLSVLSASSGESKGIRKQAINAIIACLPSNKKQLLQLTGVGSQTVKRLGDDILRCVSSVKRSRPSPSSNVTPLRTVAPLSGSGQRRSTRALHVKSDPDVLLTSLRRPPDKTIPAVTPEAFRNGKHSYAHRLTSSGFNLRVANNQPGSRRSHREPPINYTGLAQLNIFLTFVAPARVTAALMLGQTKRKAKMPRLLCGSALLSPSISTKFSRKKWGSTET